MVININSNRSEQYPPWPSRSRLRLHRRLLLSSPAPFLLPPHDLAVPWCRRGWGWGRVQVGDCRWLIKGGRTILDGRCVATTDQARSCYGRAGEQLKQKTVWCPKRTVHYQDFQTSEPCIKRRSDTRCWGTINLLPANRSLCTAQIWIEGWHFKVGRKFRRVIRTKEPPIDIGSFDTWLEIPMGPN